MGSIVSTVSSEAALSLLVAVGALGVGLGYSLRSVSEQPHSTGTTETQGSKNKKKKKKTADSSTQGDSGSTMALAPPVQVVSFPEVIPGSLDSATELASDLADSVPSVASAKSKKQKKKKAKGQQASESPAPAQPLTPAVVNDQKVATTSGKAGKAKSQKATIDTKGPASAGPSVQETSASVDTDGSWTRVNKPRRKGAAEASASDAGITTSATGNSSPVAERTEDEYISPYHRNSGENRRTLAEKLLPKPRKTGVEDILETPDVPTLSRVIRIKSADEEKPLPGYSWADYESDNVRVTDGGENDADGEDDGWEVAKGKKSRPERQPSSSSIQTPKSSASAPLTQKQRQNAKKKEEAKAAKAAERRAQEATLASYRKEREREQIAELAKKPAGKALSGGMKASIDAGGKLVWD